MNRIDEDYGCLCAYEGEECIGRLLYEIREKILYIRSLNVKEEYRRRGTGGRLFQKLQETAQRERIEGMIVSGVLLRQQQNAAIRFFLKRGFLTPEYGEQVITLSIKGWRQSYLASIPIKEAQWEERIYPMNDLPHALAYDYRNNIRGSVLPCCRIDGIKGELLPELSVAYEFQNKIAAYVLMTDVEGELYLNSVYIREKNAAFLISLLHYCFSKLEEPDCSYETMKMTLINEKGRILFQKLAKGMQVVKEDFLTMYRIEPR